MGVTLTSLFHNRFAYPTKVTAVLAPTLQFQLVCVHHLLTSLSLLLEELPPSLFKPPKQHDARATLLH